MGKLRNYFLNHYPKTDFHELNQDWMISMLFDMINQVENFVEMNSVKYADPIQWDITRQYEKNTIVVDPITGTAYISSKPIPMGVALSRTEYWNVIFDLGRFITLASQNFANSYEAVLTTTATMPTDKDNWVVWNSLLYRAKNDIHVGDRYVEDGNIERYTVEMFFDELAHLISEETSARIEADTELHNEIVDESVARENADTALESDIDAEATAREDADDALQRNIDEEATAREDADDALQRNIDTLVSKLKNDYIIVTDYGIDNTGTVDNGAAFQALVNSHPNRTYLFPDGIYNFASYQIKGNIYLLGTGNTIIKNFNWHGESQETFATPVTINGSQFTADNIIFKSDDVNYALNIDSAQQIEYIRETKIKNCKFYGRNALNLYYILCVYVENCEFIRNGIGINCTSSTNLFFNNDYFLSPSIGVKIQPISSTEARMGGETFNFTNCFWYNGITAIDATWASNIQLSNCLIDYFHAGLILTGCRECKIVESYIGYNKNGSKEGWAYYLAPRRTGAIYAEMYHDINWWSSIMCSDTQFVSYDSADSATIVLDGGTGAIKGVHDSMIHHCKFDNYSNSVNQFLYGRNIQTFYITDNIFISVEHPLSYCFNYEESSCVYIVNENNNYNACTWQGVPKAPNIGNGVYQYAETHRITLHGNGELTTDTVSITYNNAYGGDPKVIAQVSSSVSQPIIPTVISHSNTGAQISAISTTAIANGTNIVVDVIVMRDIATLR